MRWWPMPASRSIAISPTACAAGAKRNSERQRKRQAVTSTSPALVAEALEDWIGAVPLSVSLSSLEAVMAFHRLLHALQRRLRPGNIARLQRTADAGHRLLHGIALLVCALTGLALGHVRGQGGIGLLGGGQIARLDRLHQGLEVLLLAVLRRPILLRR